MEREKQLVQRILNGDLSSFEELIKIYQHQVFITVNKIIQNKDLAQDILQNIFIKVYHNLERFRFESSFKTWLLRISINETMTWLRVNKKKLRMEYIDKNVAKIEDQTDNQEEALITAEQTIQLQLALTRLNPRHREAIILRYYEDKSIKEIAEILTCSEGVVKSMLFRSLRKLKSILTTLQR